MHYIYMYAPSPHIQVLLLHSNRLACTLQANNANATHSLVLPPDPCLHLGVLAMQHAAAQFPSCPDLLKDFNYNYNTIIMISPSIVVFPRNLF